MNGQVQLIVRGYKLVKKALGTTGYHHVIMT
jgi:hypothetical protein